VSVEDLIAFDTNNSYLTTLMLVKTVVLSECFLISHLNFCNLFLNVLNKWLLDYPVYLQVFYLDIVYQFEQHWYYIYLFDNWHQCNRLYRYMNIDSLHHYTFLHYDKDGLHTHLYLQIEKRLDI